MNCPIDEALRELRAEVTLGVDNIPQSKRYIAALDAVLDILPYIDPMVKVLDSGRQDVEAQGGTATKEDRQ